MASGSGEVQKRRRSDDESSQGPPKHRRNKLVFERSTPVLRVHGYVKQLELVKEEKVWASVAMVPMSFLVDRQAHAQTYNFHVSWNTHLPLPDGPAPETVLSETQIQIINSAIDRLVYDRNSKEWVAKERPEDVGTTPLCQAFEYRFYNCRGRNGVSNLLNILFSDIGSLRPTNCGGASVHDPGVREITFNVGVDQSDSSEGETSPDASPLKRPTLEESPFLRTVTVDKIFVPDVLLEDLSKPPNCYMTVSCKSTLMNLSILDILQLKYELLPLMVSHRTAFGMVISSQSAVLVRLTKNSHEMANAEVSVEAKPYDFAGTKFREVFLQLCSDILHIVKNDIEVRVQ